MPSAVHVKIDAQTTVRVSKLRVVIKPVPIMLTIVPEMMNGTFKVLATDGDGRLAYIEPESTGQCSGEDH